MTGQEEPSRKVSFGSVLPHPRMATRNLIARIPRGPPSTYATTGPGWGRVVCATPGHLRRKFCKTHYHQKSSHFHRKSRYSWVLRCHRVCACVKLKRQGIILPRRSAISHSHTCSSSSHVRTTAYFSLGHRVFFPPKWASQESKI